MITTDENYIKIDAGIICMSFALPCIVRKASSHDTAISGLVSPGPSLLILRSDFYLECFYSPSKRRLSS